MRKVVNEKLQLVSLNLKYKTITKIYWQVSKEHGKNNVSNRMANSDILLLDR